MKYKSKEKYRKLCDAVGAKAADILELGINYEKERICKYIEECATNIDFKNTNPKEILLYLINLIKNQKEIENIENVE